MEAKLAQNINELNFGQIQVHENMSIIPLKGKTVPDLNYLTLKEAITGELLIIRELNDNGAVPKVKVFNEADLPVLLLDGEEIAGAKQNRIINTTILLKEKSETIIPVSCTEQGRWAYSTSKFHESGFLASCMVRRNKSRSVQANLKASGEFRADQGEVWEDIRNISVDAKVDSPTKAMRDVYQERETDIDNYIESFSLEENQNGLMVIINGEVVGIDVLSSPLAYQELHNKLLKSYALEALFNQESEKKSKSALDLAKTFLEEVKNSEVETHKSPGYGYDYRYQSPKAVGSSLIYKKEFIHVAFFRKADSEPGKTSSFQQRRSFRL
jgi:hypothetical protein